ncbi:MAG: hypothetical protein Ct9H90mP9_3780 [Pseudomonadota bacterium]|nr:MAG: hypothetical protein Ct9H90mP9_3780 [Pseudomonadota bacterium]
MNCSGGNLLVLAVVVLLMILWGNDLFEKPSGRRFRDWTELKLPMFNRIWIKILVARYCQTLGTLLKSGVDLKTSLEIANTWWSTAVSSVLWTR